MSGAHARLSPSSAKRWMTCAAAPNREEGVPDTTNEYAEWGTAAHAIMEQAILQDMHPDDLGLDDLTIESDDPDWAPVYKLIDRYGIHDIQEMREVAAVGYEYTLFSGEVRAECKVNPGGVINRTDNHGTADIQILNPMHLEVADLKAGQGVAVEPNDPQLWEYAAGALHMHPLRYPRREWPNITVKLTIIQPRKPHPDGLIRSIEVPASHIMTWMENTVGPAAIATDDPNAVATPSEDACRWCKVKATCPELAQQGLAAAQAVFQPVAVGGDREALATSLTRNPDQLNPEEIRFILDNEKLIAGWLDAVRKFARKTLEDGGEIPGYKMVLGRKSRKWSMDPTELYARFRNLTKQDKKKITKGDLYEEVFLSPAKAEKQLKDLLGASTWERIAECIITSAGAPALAPETDSRPPMKLKASEVFTPVDDTPDYLK